MITWTCHICKEKRPDDKISVFPKPVKIQGRTIHQNIRYCNDRPECLLGTKTFSFFKVEKK